MKKQVEDKKTALLQAALKLFTERGFHGTSTAQISKEAGVATGTLFNYFPTKEDLINGLYLDVKGKLSRIMGEDLQTQNTFHAKLKKIWYNMIEWGINNPDDFLFVGQFCSSPYITSYTREEVAKEYVFLSDLVKEGITNGDIKDYSVELITSMFYQSSRAVVNLILDYEPEDKDKVIEDGFQVVWEGLVKK
ncbi:Transcriptional regulator, TetR family [Methanosarcina siciliae T4/M]|uniref:Transcriptional regulator, TetR family n=2 Tax=Methanosarcina siciliae TaxID=38027 RepID=A0A0E3PAD9_9EURY|nr:TetR/AcrR family transcriptional regulator [Methanosarcina siciliae]AKB27051.1 Transcriptional regulator, TetR family [Methanosarcina siciliae T4/M]AKB31017.1 Transcriptional regulator, TetR family [Methanosarcina siciliae HI350]